MFAVCITRFKTKKKKEKLYVLPTPCIYVSCMDLRNNSYYFPIQHKLTGFYNRD